MVKKSQPNPAPENVYAERLRRVREEHGEDIKTFHARVKKKGDLTVSYAAARHYDFDRVAPPDYFVAVANLYDVPLHFLLTGEGPSTNREEAAGEPDENRFDKAWRALRTVTKRHIPYRHRPLSPLEQEALQDLLVRLLDAGPDKEFEDYDEEQMAGALEGLTWLLWLPLMVLGNPRYTDGQDVTPPPDPDGRYFMAMYQALSLAMPAAGEGRKDHTVTTVRALQRLKESIKERLTHFRWILRGPDRRGLFMAGGVNAIRASFREYETDEGEGVEKVIPDDDVLLRIYQRAVGWDRARKAVENVTRDLDAIKGPEKLGDLVREHLKENPSKTWEEAVAAIMEGTDTDD